MRAVKYEMKVNKRGKIVLPSLSLKQGTSVEVIVLVHDHDEESTDLLAASGSSLDFWDNPIDDEVWNDA
jgi:hypothetical protein